MANINVNDLKPGVTFIGKDDNIYLTIEAEHAKSGRGQAHVKVKAKNMRNNSVNVLTFTGGEKINQAYINKKTMQFLYQDGNEFIFMDQEDFNQIKLTSDKFEEEFKFLSEESIVKILLYNEEVLGLEIPKNVTLTVTETADAVKGDTANKATKKAILETGIEIDVPQFIKTNDKIIVNTETGKYVNKV